MTLFIIAYLAGLLTIATPCIFPILPFVLARAGEPFLRSGLPLLLGLAVAFAVVATLASVAGGWANLAGEQRSAILGGCANATGSIAATDPGCNASSGEFDSIGGGYDDLASGGFGTFVAGGNTNTASGANSLIAGGFDSTVASGEGSTLSQFGGSDDLASTFNNESEVGGTLFGP